MLLWGELEFQLLCTLKEEKIYFKVKSMFQWTLNQLTLITRSFSNDSTIFAQLFAFIKRTFTRKEYGKRCLLASFVFDNCQNPKKNFSKSSLRFGCQTRAERIQKKNFFRKPFSCQPSKSLSRKLPLQLLGRNKNAKKC